MSKPKWCYLKDQEYMTLALTNANPCHACEHNLSCSYMEDKFATVKIGFDDLLVTENKELPRGTVYCQHCNKNSATYVAEVVNRKGKYFVIQCSCCHQRWLKSVSEYKRQNTGFVNAFGEYIPPANHHKAMPRNIQLKLKRQHNEIRASLGLEVENPEPKYIYGGPKRGLILNPKYKE